MKKIKLILLIALFIILSLITVVNANEANITLSASNNKIEKQEVIEVTVNLNDLQSNGAKVLTGKIDFDESVLEYVEKSFKAGWTGAVSDDGTSFNAFGYEEIKGNEILTLKFKLKEDVKEKETKITAHDLKLVLEENTEEQNLQNSEINFEIVSKTNNLYIIVLAIAVIVIAALVVIFIKRKK